MPIQAEETRMQELFRAVHVGNQEKIEKAVKKEIEILHKNADTIEQYRLATMEIVSGFYRFCVNNSIDFNGISKDMQSNYEKVPEMDESTLVLPIPAVTTAPIIRYAHLQNRSHASVNSAIFSSISSSTIRSVFPRYINS